jgi:hypothetical protein
MIRTLAFVFAKTNPMLLRLRLRIPAVKAARTHSQSKRLSPGPPATCNELNGSVADQLHQRERNRQC